MSKTFKSIFSIVLVLALVFSTMPATVFAEHDTTLGASGTVTDFAPLDEQTASQYYGVGEKQLDALDLPDSLTATLQEDDVASSGTTSQTSEIAIPVLEWQATPAYDPNVLGTYVFTPTLDLGGYALDSGTQPPSVTVGIIEKQGIVPANAAAATTLAGTINAWAGGNGIVATSGTTTVTVTSTGTPVDGSTLTLVIPEDVTVDWQAKLTSSASNAITISNTSGAGSVFQVSTGADLKSTYMSGSNVILNSGISTVKVTGGEISGGGGSSGSIGINNNSTGVVEVSGTAAGTVINGGTGASSYGIYNAAGGEVKVTGGTINGSNAATGGTNSYGIYNNGAGTVTVTGGTVNGGGKSAAGAKSYGVFNNAGGTVGVSGTATINGGIGTDNYGVFNNGTSTTVTVTGGTVNGGSSGTNSNGVYNNSTGTVTVSGCTINGGSGADSFGIYNGASGTIKLSGTVAINSGDWGIYSNGAVQIGALPNITITTGEAAIKTAAALAADQGPPVVTFDVRGGASFINTDILTLQTDSYKNGTGVTAKYAKIAPPSPSGETKSAIETWLTDNGITGLTVAVNDTTNTVTITGTAIPNPTNATLALALAIPAGVTVDWSATLTSSAGKVINLTGADATSVFKMTGGSLTSTANTGDTSVIYNSGAGTVNVSGGVINAGSGDSSTGIYNNGTGIVNVSGTAAINGGSGADSTGIYNNGTGIVNVSGTAAINGGSGADSTGIYNNGTGTVNISGGTINGGTGTDSSYGVYNHAGGTVNLSGTVTITCAGTTDSVGINNNSGTVKIGANADVTITAGTAAIKTTSALATDTSFTVKGGASSSNSDILTLQTDAYKNVGGTTAKYAKISTAPSTEPSIAITSTGLTGLKVGQAVTGTIVYTLSNGTYATPITTANFAVTNLPAGLSVGTVTRTSDTVVTVTITGTPTTANASTTTVTIPVIPQANVTGATADITPTGTVIASAVANATSGNATSGNDSSSSGSGSGSSASSVSASASVVSSIDDKTLGTAINSAVNAASGGTSLDVRLKNISNFTKENAAAILAKAKGKNATVSSDVMSENSKFVEVRVTLDPALITKTVRLDGYIREAQTSMTESKFNKHFANNIMVVRLGQEGKFGQAAKVAARLDPGKFDSVSNLYFYNYDKKTNKYTRIPEPKHWVDKNSYLHFYTELGGDIIISEYPLDKK